MTADFTHAELMEALEQRNLWVMRELRRSRWVALPVIWAAAVVMVVGPLLLPTVAAVVVASVGAVVQAVAAGWVLVRSPERLRRRWNERYAAVGAHLVARGMP